MRLERESGGREKERIEAFAKEDLKQWMIESKVGNEMTFKKMGIIFKCPLVNSQFSLFEVIFCKVTINTELLLGEI